MDHPLHHAACDYARHAPWLCRVGAEDLEAHEVDDGCKCPACRTADAVAESMDMVPVLIAWDAPIFVGASREEQRAAVLAVGGTEVPPGGQIGGQLLTDGSVSPATGGCWRLPASSTAARSGGR